MAEKLALIAGESSLGEISFREAQKAGKDVYLIAIRSFTPRSLFVQAERKILIEIDQLETMLDYLKSNQIEEFLMIGRIPHAIIFKKARRLKRLIELIKPDALSTTAIFKAFIAYLEREKINVLNSTIFLKPLIAEKKVYTPQIEIEPEFKSDLQLAYEKASVLAKADIGQLVCLKNSVVLAVEALEGTDRTIKRAAKLAGKGFVCAKVAQRGADLRFDVPVIGLKTFALLKKFSVRGLIVEAEKTIILDKEIFVRRMNEAKIYFEAR